MDGVVTVDADGIVLALVEIHGSCVYAVYCNEVNALVILGWREEEVTAGSLYMNWALAGGIHFCWQSDDIAPSRIC